MWLLSTDRAELHFFVTPEDIKEGYAILSHVWGDKEQSFQAIRALQERCEADHSNPRDQAMDKIRLSCEIAESHGMRWIWNDTCCIDKTSSVDVSEAINSMYRYYSLAKVCYAYLADVPSSDEVSDDSSAFRGSKWHERGWTLQELLAPRFLVFLSREWMVLGTKYELASVLTAVTRVPQAVLMQEVPITDMSVAARMALAAYRQTTRPEDKAYSLMGIFDVNLPPLYGEGLKRAFWRLQEEIMKHTPDTTIFAWPGGGILLASAQGHSETPPLSEFHPMHVSHDNHCSSLLAESPYDFKECHDVQFEPYSPQDNPFTVLGPTVSSPLSST
ncbi:HET-domain-containing protein [Dichomitus squalens LYAD-421 SS1]|uniref:HET-domain-containing protein n=1 Tax=Dichomitus squalens (strain LYAD-421) TaxID=732165 RepID=R7SUT3_DICSQ|nr:HET-domain-containing protein [Dichomitus squalens LYAD-421 SS1]EJF58707.1 HET-domain-containing protein [Dichomitus squalens LYAD-421 SS1]